MKEVLQPLNQKAKDVVVNRLDLLDTPSVHPLLLQYVAHVSAYSVILKRCGPQAGLHLCTPHLPRSCACQKCCESDHHVSHSCASQLTMYPGGG